MPDTGNIPHFHLKVILLTHFILFSISTLDSWVSSGYLIYNLGLIGCLIWAILKPESSEAVQFSLVINAVSILLDIIWISVSHKGNIVSFAFSIVFLVARPFTCFYLMQIVRERTGNTNVFSNVFGERRNTSYEDIERPPAGVPHAQQAGSYDFSNAQQI